MPSDRVVKALQLNDAMFKQLFGVQKETFYTMHNIFHQAFQSKHRQGGRPPRLTIGDKCLTTLQYWREYRSMNHLAYEYEVHKSLAHRVILWGEQTLSQDSTLHLPSKKALRDAEPTWEVMLADITEHPIERPKKTAKILFRQEKATQHTEFILWRK